MAGNKRKKFVPVHWMEPTSDNDWEPSSIPSSLSFVKKTFRPPPTNNTESEVSESDRDYPNTTPQLAEHTSANEPFVAMSTSDEDNVITLSAEEEVEISSADEAVKCNNFEQLYLQHESFTYENDEVPDDPKQEVEEEEEEEEEEEDEQQYDEEEQRLPVRLIFKHLPIY